jgi:hypothetical protein
LQLLDRTGLTNRRFVLASRGSDAKSEFVSRTAPGVA